MLVPGNLATNQRGPRCSQRDRAIQGSGNLGRGCLVHSHSRIHVHGVSQGRGYTKSPRSRQMTQPRACNKTPMSATLSSAHAIRSCRTSGNKVPGPSQSPGTAEVPSMLSTSLSLAPRKQPKPSKGFGAQGGLGGPIGRRLRSILTGARQSKVQANCWTTHV